MALEEVWKEDGIRMESIVNNEFSPQKSVGDGKAFAFTFSLMEYLTVLIKRTLHSKWSSLPAGM